MALRKLPIEQMVDSALGRAQAQARALDLVRDLVSGILLLHLLSLRNPSTTSAIMICRHLSDYLGGELASNLDSVMNDRFASPTGVSQCTTNYEWRDEYDWDCGMFEKYEQCGGGLDWPYADDAFPAAARTECCACQTESFANSAMAQGCVDDSKWSADAVANAINGVFGTLVVSGEDVTTYLHASGHDGNIRVLIEKLDELSCIRHRGPLFGALCICRELLVQKMHREWRINQRLSQRLIPKAQCSRKSFTYGWI